MGNFFQVARPDGNSLERWKWRHRYLIWTWSLTGAALCLVRCILESRDWQLVSWFTLSTFAIAFPLAVALGAAWAFSLSNLYRFFPAVAVDRWRHSIARVPIQFLRAVGWILTLAALCFTVIGAFTEGGPWFGIGWIALVALVFFVVWRIRG